MSLSSPDSHPAEPRQLRFAQHQFYSLHTSWIPQGLQAVAEAERQGNTARVFAYPDATDHFGIGPAMVQSLRFWLRATGLLVEMPGAGARRIPTLTPLGRLLERADPYLNQPASVWLLHAHLVRTVEQAPAFTWFFQHFVSSLPFTKEECVQACHAWAIKEAPAQEVRPNALREDIACVLRMYLPARPGSPEQQEARSPFARLGLLMPMAHANRPEDFPQGPGPDRYRFRLPQATEVPALAILAVLLQQQAGKQVPLRTLFEPMQIARTFGLSSRTLSEVLATLRVLAPAWCPTLERVGRHFQVRVPAVPVDQVLAHLYPPRP